MQHHAIQSSHILIVGPDTAVKTVEGIFTNQTEWRCVRADSATQAMWLLRREAELDVVVIAPGMRIEAYGELTRDVKFGRSGGMTPVVFILEPSLADRRADVYESGADDCIQLPASRQEIVLRVLNAIRVKRATDSLEDATAVITSLANAIEGRDAYTCGHVERVATYAVEIAKRLGVPEKNLETIRIGGMVHDIGKVIVPDQILNKPGRLTDEEMNVVKRHPVVGHEILKPLRTMQEVLPIVRWHHERPNGRGYPDGLSGDDLPLFPRIVAVADCFDAISTSRPYRPAMPPQECQTLMGRLAGTGDLAPDLVNILLEIIDQNTHQLAEVGA
ncbi:MAG TPA: HD domain-containing phosphohydrolase [Phycisphaerae bacterium]|nr:HD domain-containing phosphohydrolase [Phycisphaerae bacterium]